MAFVIKFSPDAIGLGTDITHHDLSKFKVTYFSEKHDEFLEHLSNATNYSTLESAKTVLDKLSFGNKHHAVIEDITDPSNPKIVS